MKKKHLNLLLFVLIAACAFLAVSCGFYPTDVGDRPDKFLFFEIDKGGTSLLLGLTGALLFFYWQIRIKFSRQNPSLTYDELYLYVHNQIDLNDIIKKLNCKDDEFGLAMANVKGGHSLVRIVTVMILWSRFLNPTKFLYWILVIVTCLALRYGTELLGINMLGIRKFWIVITSIVCVLYFAIVLIL